MNNPWTGLLVVFAICVASADAGHPQVVIGAVLALIIGTLTARVLRADPGSLRQGLFGFSPLLTGIALPTFLGNNPLMWVYLVLGAAVTTVVTFAISNVFNTWGVPALTFPFVLATWFLLLGAYHFKGIGVGGLTPPALPHHQLAGGFDWGELVPAWLRGVSQVFLLNNWVGGLLILAGLAVNSRWAVGCAVGGTIVATLIAIWFGASPADVGKGLYAYSAVLTAVALGCVFYKPSRPTLLYALAGTVFTVFVQAALGTALTPIGIPPLTAPFVFATWLFLLPKRHFVPTPHHKPVSDGILTKTST